MDTQLQELKIKQDSNEVEREEQDLSSKRTKCLCYTRVCGWLVNKSAFNPGKVAEDKDRVKFKNPIR